MFHKIITTVFGIGYIGRGGGTLAALVCSIIWYLLDINGLEAIISTLAILGIGIWSAQKVEQEWGKDSSKVVIDEVAGMAISLLFIPLVIKYTIIAFLLFRFFDIVKPLYIRKAEKLPGGWGVMMDDALAGIYSNFLLQVLLFFKLI